MTSGRAGAGAPAEKALSVLSRLQHGIEELYRVRTDLEVDAFVVDEDQREHALSGGSPGSEPQRRPREQLLVSTDDTGQVGIGLFFDRAVLDNLARNDPAEGLDERNFFDFSLAVEGVSHFVYLARCAAHDRQVRAVELELQAEVDKFVTCWLLARAADARAGRPTAPDDADSVRTRLFHHAALDDELSLQERERYQLANDLADRYAGSLSQRYVRGNRIMDMLRELRGFYRLDLDGKIGHIRAQRAA